MKLTIREALEITPLKNAKVLAGEIGLDREILNVNVVEVPDTVRWMRGGEIMFSSGFAFSGDAEKGIALLSSLNSHNISALVLKPGAYMSKVPEAMIQYADHIGFPLLEIPEDMPFNTYIEAIYALLLDKKTYLFSLDSSANHSPGETSTFFGEVKNICNILVERINAPVLYLSINGSVQEIFRRADQAVTELEDHLSGRNDLSEWKCAYISEWERAYYLTPICVNAEPQGYLAVKKAANFPLATEIAMMEYAALMISQELQKERAFIEQKKKYRRELLKDLISKTFDDRNMLKRRCELLEFNMSDPYIAFAIASVSDGSTAGDSENLNTTRNYICNFLERNSLQNTCSVLLTEDDDLILGVLSFPKQQNAVVLARRLLMDMLDNLRNACKHVRVTVGISSPNLGVEQIAGAVQEAREAIRVNMHLSNERPLVSLEELGIYRILCELRSSKVMQEFCHTMLQPILESDNGEELLKTLESYYNNECNLRKTAEELYLHKNSVKYRLSRIEQLLGWSITEPDMELNLKLCLKYCQIL